MRKVKNEKGAVLVFMTLMIVLLMIMVGMGLDTGQITYTRSQGQSAVDAAALSAVSGLPIGAAQVNGRVAAFNAKNDYLSSPANPIGPSNITYVQYDHVTGTITELPDITNANGVRVALESTNPYTSVAAGTAMKSPLFLTPLLNLFGQSAPGTANVSVSAVAALRAVPSIPIAIMEDLCMAKSAGNPGMNSGIWLRQTNATVDNSCWTTYTENPPSANRVQALFTSSKSCSDLPANSAMLTPGVTQIELNNGQAASTYDEAGNLFLPGGSPTGAWWYVPIVPTVTKCNQTDLFLGWAKIQVTDVQKQGSPKYIEANVACGQSDMWNTKNSMCFSSRLLRDTKSGM